MAKGRIIKIISNQYTVLSENNEKLLCVAMGKVRLQKTPFVGDFVEYTCFDNQIGIEKILPRKNELIRPSIANVDQALIVMSAVDPEFSCTLVDRIGFLIMLAKIEPVLLITKMDLIDENHPVHGFIADYRKSNYRVSTSGKGMDNHEIEAILKDRITVLTGQSGVGKSSFLNRLNPDFKLRTQITSKALGRGKHTTRHVELHEIAEGWVADTPGFSSLDFSRVSIDDLAQSVNDFKPYIGKCRFRNCIHDFEPGCAVKEAVSKGEVSSIRYQNYLDCLKLIHSTAKEKYE